MLEHLAKPCTAFEGSRLLSSGPLIEVVLAVKNANERGAAEPVFVFDDASGRVLDFDLRGSKAEVIARVSQPSPAASAGVPAQRVADAAEAEDSTAPRGRGRPRLGVVGREITLLPRHWEWLDAQPGGASVTLRKLVEEARRGSGGTRKLRAAQEAAYHFMSAMAGNLPGFEEATRALFAGDRERFEQQMREWPADFQVYALRLAFGAAGEGQP